MEVSGGSTNQRTLIAFGAKFNPLIDQGEYWRLLAPVFLHIGVQHLVFNGFAILTFGRLAEIVYGHGRFLAVYLVSGITGATFSYLLSRGVSAGASGAIFGVAGALGVFFARNRHVPGVAGQLPGILMLLAINGVYGMLDRRVDNWGHLGGLVGGVALAMWLAPSIVPVRDEEEQVAALQRKESGAASWLVVPATLGVVALAVMVAGGG